MVMCAIFHFQIHFLYIYIYIGAERQKIKRKYVMYKRRRNHVAFLDQSKLKISVPSDKVDEIGR